MRTPTIKLIANIVISTFCFVIISSAVCTDKLCAQGLEDIMPQFSSDGNFECTIKRLNSRKEIITLQASIKNVSAKKQKLEFDYVSVYLIDMESMKKYHPLRDEKKRIIAGPRDCHDHAEGEIDRNIEPEGQVIVWIKFPDVQTQAVDIFFPDFIPFEEVPIAR